MADMYSPEKRSEIMASIRSKNSLAERLVFKYLRDQNIYFQKHYKRAPGSPDVVLPRKKLAVFIDGDFWHGKELQRIIQKHGEGSFWANKIHTNIERDTRKRAELRDMGWSVLQVWESDLTRKRTQQDSLSQIALFLKDNIKFD